MLHRGARAWVQLNDDRYALELGPLYEHRTTVGGNSGVAVSIPAGVADDITYVGDAHHRGAVLTVTGEFRRANPDDGGGPGIHAGIARITDPGRPVGRPVDGVRIATAAVVFAAALAAAVLAHNDTATRPQRGRQPTGGDNTGSGLAAFVVRVLGRSSIRAQRRGDGGW